MTFDFLSLLTGDYLARFAAGLGMTLRLFLTSLFTGLALATVLLSLRETRIRTLDYIVRMFVDYHRNVPALIQLFVWYFGISSLLPKIIQTWINDRDSEFIFAYIALSLNAAAYMSEDLRSGLRSIERGQMDAARALGLNFLQTMRDVMMPQAFRAAIPPLISQSLSLFKSTSLALAIGVAELMYYARQIDNETFRTFETFAIVSVIYLVGSWLITGIGYFADQKFRRAKGR